MLEARHAPVAVVSAAVLVRQGLGAWMQLEDSPGIDPHPGKGISQHGAGLPRAEHSEVLAVLSTLVLNLCDQRESA